MHFKGREGKLGYALAFRGESGAAMVFDWMETDI